MPGGRFIALAWLFVFLGLFLSQGKFSMSQPELDREIAQATGESLGTIRRRGFSLVPAMPSVFDPDADELRWPQYLDWDEVDAQRQRAA
jgi:hypothetical protein